MILLSKITFNFCYRIVLDYLFVSVSAFIFQESTKKITKIFIKKKWNVEGFFPMNDGKRHSRCNMQSWTKNRHLKMFSNPSKNNNVLTDDISFKGPAELDIQVVETLNSLIDAVSKKCSNNENPHPKKTTSSSTRISRKSTPTRFIDISSSSIVTTTPPEFIVAHSKEELHQILDEYFDRTFTQYIKRITKRCPTDDQGRYSKI